MNANKNNSILSAKNAKYTKKHYLRDRPTTLPNFMITRTSVFLRILRLFASISGQN